MSRWFYILLPIASAALLWFAFTTRENIEPPAPGVIDTRLIIGNNSELQAVLKLRKEWQRESDLRNLLTAVRHHRQSQTADFLQRESRMIEQGAGMRFKSLAEIKTESAMNELERRYSTLRQGRLRMWNHISSKASQELDETYRELIQSRREDFMTEEKRRLFNLKLKLDVLSKDPIVMPDSRRLRILDEIDRISDSIKMAEKDYVDSMEAAFRESSQDMESRLESMRDEIEDDLRVSIDDALDEMEKNLDTELDKEKAITRDIVEAAMKKRAVATGAPSAGPANTSFTGGLDLSYIESAEQRIRTEGLRRIRRKTPAIARRRNVYIVFDTPYPAFSATVNLTPEYLEIENPLKTDQEKEHDNSR